MQVDSMPSTEVDRSRMISKKDYDKFEHIFLTYNPFRQLNAISNECDTKLRFFGNNVIIANILTHTYS